MADLQDDSISLSPAKRPADPTLKRGKKTTKKRQRQAEPQSSAPRFELQQRKNSPSLSDIRNLVLWMLTLEHGSTPQWVFTPVRTTQNKHEVTQVILLFLPGLDAFTLKDHSDAAPFLYEFLPKNEHFTILRSQCDRKAPPMSYLRQVFELNRDTSGEKDCFESIPPLANPDGTAHTDPAEYEKFILTEDQLANNQFPLDSEASFLATAPAPDSLPAKMKVIAIDCEMVRSEQGMELARVSLVNLAGEILYDAFVKPSNMVIDYLTQYSGITASTLKHIQLTLEQARSEVMKYIYRETILCGHSLENDLRALRIIHKRVVDTSVIYPHNVKELKWSLKRLAERYLRLSIQSVRNRQKKGHDSVEDARAALSLTREKVMYGAKFGVPHPNMVTENLFEVLTKYHRKTAIVGFAPDKDLIQGNVTVDLSGSLEKYVGGDTSFVVTEWRNLMGSERVDEVLAAWNQRIVTMVGASPPGTGWIIATGEGDAAIYQRLAACKAGDPEAWTFQQEQQLHLADARCKKGFGVFFFPGQLKVN